MGKRRRGDDQFQRDADYRRALGVPTNQALPNQIGQAESAGAARGGRGQPAPNPARGTTPRKRRTAGQATTAEQQKPATKQKPRSGQAASAASRSTKATKSLGSSPGRVPGTTAARIAGTCPACQKPFAVGATIRKLTVGWGHAACAALDQDTAEFHRNKARIEAGETYRSQQISTWRRGQSPGSAPQRP